MAKDRPAATYSTARVETYTDGVFAIAATLLVLDLTTAAIGAVDSDAELWAALGRMWPNFVSFCVSFVLLSGLWLIHLQQFRSIVTADALLIWLNAVRLLFVVLIPFTTSLVSQFSDFYAGRMLLPINFFFAALFGHLSWRWAAARNGHLLAPEAVADIPVQGAGGLSAVVCGGIAALISPWLGSWAFTVYVLNGPLAVLLARRARRNAGAAPD